MLKSTPNTAVPVGGDGKSALQLWAPLGALLLVCIALASVITQRGQADARAARRAWLAHRNANCKPDGKATWVSLSDGEDPREDARLTMYSCSDGKRFAVTRALEDQLILDAEAAPPGA